MNVECAINKKCVSRLQKKMEEIIIVWIAGEL